MDILSTSTPKAKKDHKYNYCGFVISKVEKYIHTAIKGDYLYVWKSHFRCEAIAWKLKMFDECDEGVTENDFYEYINEKYLSLLSDENDKLKTFGERLDFVCKYYNI